MFPLGQHTESVTGGGQDCILNWLRNLAMCKYLPSGTGFGGNKTTVLKGSWRVAEAGHCERLGEVAGESPASVAEKP